MLYGPWCQDRNLSVGYDWLVDEFSTLRLLPRKHRRGMKH